MEIDKEIEKTKDDVIDYKDFEKLKVDVLRDALKDTTDTIRAIDRKIVFYLRLVLAIGGAYFAVAMFGFKETFTFTHFDMLIYSLPIILFFGVALFKLSEAVNPILNPTEIFTTCDDKNFGSNSFFIQIIVKDKDTKKEKVLDINLDSLVNNFNTSITDIEALKKLLFKEIAKVSYIRDKKNTMLSKSLIQINYGFVSIVLMLSFMASDISFCEMATLIITGITK